MEMSAYSTTTYSASTTPPRATTTTSNDRAAHLITRTVQCNIQWMLAVFIMFIILDACYLSTNDECMDLNVQTFQNFKISFRGAFITRIVANCISALVLIVTQGAICCYYREITHGASADAVGEALTTTFPDLQSVKYPIHGLYILGDAFLMIVFFKTDTSVCSDSVTTYIIINILLCLLYNLGNNENSNKKSN